MTVPWARGAEVRDFEQGNRVLDRWRAERPDLWVMIAIDGTPMLRAAPLREMANRASTPAPERF
jgi:hypothetical protein